MHEFYPWPFPSEFSSFHHNGNLNFQSGSENFSPPIHSHSSDSRTAQLIHETEDSKDGTSKKTVRDPLSHRIIEKRRRDRMNNCLADLSKLIPTSYLKKGRGRIEKTEIIEMAIKHVKHLEAHNKVNCVDINRCELRATEEEKKEEFRHGFREATSEVMRFLVEMRGLYPGDALCQGLVGHLRDHLAKILPGTPGEMLFRGRSGSEVRGRSASISSVLSEGTTRSGSTPTPTKNGAETMETESIDSHRLPKIEGASRLRDMLRTEIDGERISNGVCAVSACNGGAGGEEENTSASSSLVAKAIPSCPKNRENGAVNGLNRPTSVSPSSECYRSFKKGIRERFQSDMRQEYKQSCTNIASQSSDSANTQGSSNFSLGSSSECQSKGSHQDPKVASSSSISPPFHHQLNGSKVFKYKEKVITSIPAFALHPNGSFYIPLTINPSLISHWFACPETEDLFSVLHPVNIPVNFSYIQRLNQLYPINTNPASYSSESHHSRQQGNQQILLTAN